MPRESRSQKKTVGRVMHEFKHGELETRGRKVRSPRQAIAIALSEAGASRNQSSAEKRRSLSRTKRKERRGETARDMKEGRGKEGRGRRKTARRTARGSSTTRAELYAEARRRNVPGRSRMNKAELERALRRRR